MKPHLDTEGFARYTEGQQWFDGPGRHLVERLWYKMTQHLVPEVEVLRSPLKVLRHHVTGRRLGCTGDGIVPLTGYDSVPATAGALQIR